MSHRVYAVAAYTVGALSSGFAIIAAQAAMWWPVAVLVLASSILYGTGEHHRDRHRAAKRAREARERAVRAVILGGPAIVAAMAAIGEAARNAAAGFAQVRASLDEQHKEDGAA